MPIKARIDMLATGIRTPIGVKVFGNDLETIANVTADLERVLGSVPHTRSVYAERELGGFFIDVVPDRQAITRYGLSVRDVLDVVESGIGGMPIDTTYEGRERYQVVIRYPRELRDDIAQLEHVLVPVSRGTTTAFVPLGQLARIAPAMGPPMIKSEMGQLAGWLYVDIDTDDIGGYVGAAKAAVAGITLPPGHTLQWSGQYELFERVRERLAIILPLTIAIVFVILYLNFRGAAQALIVMTSVPFAAVGAIWTLWLARFNTSIAVWVGMIALLGVAAETASVMVVYLDDAWRAGRADGTLVTRDDLVAAAREAASLRVRPLLMTVMTNVFGLLPILLDNGVGADVAKRIAAPMWGGLVSLTILTLLVIPAVYVSWRGFQLKGRDSHSLDAMRDHEGEPHPVAS
jgi:Cu(I)/Ag(I) efflux system membrane protein CusA/SilA